MSARRPSMCCRPLAKRQPFQLSQRAALYGQSNLFERIGAGTLMSIPPMLSIRCLKLRKSTTITWLIVSPVKSWIVRTASGMPPTGNAVLIRSSPCPEIGTRRSRGIDRYTSRCRLGSVRKIMIESLWFRVTRRSVFSWSRPSRRIVVACESSRPCCFVSTEIATGSSRAFAFFTPLRNDR